MSSDVSIKDLSQLKASPLGGLKAKTAKVEVGDIAALIKAQKEKVCYALCELLCYFFHVMFCFFCNLSTNRSVMTVTRNCSSKRTVMKKIVWS